MSPGYSLEPRPYSRVLGTVGAVITIVLSIKDARSRKSSLTRENKNSGGGGGVNGFTRSRRAQSLLFFPSINTKTKGDCLRDDFPKLLVQLLYAPLKVC